MKLPTAKTRRVVFNEITENAISRRVRGAARPIDMNKVNAQQARRVLDRLVGYQLSPLLWKNVRARGLQRRARVQSVAVRLISSSERDRGVEGGGVLGDRGNWRRSIRLPRDPVSSARN